MEKALPPIPAKRYFTIGEVSDLCGVKPYVLRYWEQEFTQLKPMKRRGNRRYYQHHEVLLIRRIRDLLYEQGFTISGARNRLTETVHGRGHAEIGTDVDDGGKPLPSVDATEFDELAESSTHDIAEHDTLVPLDVSLAPSEVTTAPPEASTVALSMPQMRQELISIRGLLLV